MYGLQEEEEEEEELVVPSVREPTRQVNYVLYCRVADPHHFIFSLKCGSRYEFSL
jgi:hypothetical protein